MTQTSMTQTSMTEAKVTEASPAEASPTEASPTETGTAGANAAHRPKTFRAAGGDGRWESVDVLAYKADGMAPFKDITRQILFDDAALGCELRYFEMAAGGHSTLERHEHAHAVMILRGKGRCMVGDEVRDVGPRDLVSIPPLAWHQFRASPHEPLGFLCMVNRERDRPQLPTDEERAAMRKTPDIIAFLDGR